MKSLGEEPAKKTAVVSVLQALNGMSYSDAQDILDLVKHFLAINCLLDSDFAQDILNQIDIADA